MIIPDTFLSVHEELILFIFSVLMGVGLGLVFDIFRAFRVIIPHKATAAALEDILFFLIWSCGIICFTSVFAKGDFRGFFIAGSIIGFVLWRVSVGNPLVKLLSRIFGFIFRIIRKIFSPAVNTVIRIYRKFRHKFVKNAKNKNIWSAPLIDVRKMLYNIHNQNRKKGEKKHGSGKSN